MDNLTIGQRIAQQRKKLELSQMGLAARLDVSRQAISKWESDLAIPEIDKLITLSKLFGVSVGWLLGVEEQPSAAESTISESQFQKIEELVKKYQAPQKPHLTVFHYLFAMGASLLIFLLLYGTTTGLEKQILQYQENIASIDQRLEILENAASVQTSSTPGQLLAGYSFDLYPYTKTKSTHRVKASFSAVPNVWNQEDTGYLCISSSDGSREPIRIKCSWDGSRLTAQVTLDVANGYGLCFAVEHAGGSQEQQVLENEILCRLASACSIPMWAEYGSFAYRDGAVILSECTASLRLPEIYQNISAIPNVELCEFRLYRRPRNDSQYQLFRADLTDYLEHGLSAEYLYQITAPTLQFENVDIRNCSYLQLAFYVKLTSGVEGELPLAIFLPDGSGGLTD